MKIFNPETKHASSRHIRLYSFYELLFTLVDFGAAFLFIVGSILFFRESTTYIGTWLFLVGSTFFALKPTIRMVREIHLLKIGLRAKTLGLSIALGEAGAHVSTCGLVRSPPVTAQSTDQSN